VPAQPDGVTGLTRPARALIGWMPPTLAEMYLGGLTLGRPVSTAERGLARRAREAVAARPAGIDQKGVLAELPRRLDGHVARLRRSAAGAAKFKTGWNVALVDLTRVCAFQPAVVAEAAVDRVQDVAPDDLAAIAAITLPTGGAEPPRVQFDVSRQTYMMVSPNLNLKIVGTASGPAPEGPGAIALGFTVMAAPSFVDVVSFRGRVLLQDGYHRAHGFLRRGITRVPAFTRGLEAIEDLLPPGAFLPQDSYLGSRPPVLPDYLDDQVAATVAIPAVQKMVLIQGVELSPGA
jgi:hypothetical protein